MECLFCFNQYNNDLLEKCKFCYNYLCINCIEQLDKKYTIQENTIIYTLKCPFCRSTIVHYDTINNFFSSNQST